MKTYSNKELSNSVYYPACGIDLRPIFEFSSISNLFIYADYGYEDWSITNDDFLKRQKQRELAKTDSLEPRDFENIFQPHTLESLQARNQSDWGAKVGLIGKIQKLNQELAPDYLEFDDGDGKDMSNLGLGETGFYESPIYCAMTECEKEEYRRKKYKCLWARELILHGKIKSIPCKIKLLYIAAEGIVTYYNLFNSGEIAPQMLVTIQSGASRFEDPEGIFARILNACVEKPCFWARGGQKTFPNQEYGLYNICVKEYEDWDNTGKGANVKVVKREGANLQL